MILDTQLSNKNIKQPSLLFFVVCLWTHRDFFLLTVLLLGSFRGVPIIGITETKTKVSKFRYYYREISLGLDKFLEMESSKNKKVEKRGYDLVKEGDDSQNHLTQSKKPKLPGLARYCNAMFTSIHSLWSWLVFSIYWFFLMLVCDNLVWIRLFFLGCYNCWDDCCMIGMQLMLTVIDLW